MFHLGRWRWVAAGAVPIIAIIAALSGAALSSASGPSASSTAAPAGSIVTHSPTASSGALTIQSANAADLATQGIILQQTTTSVAVHKTTAADMASARFPGSSVHDVVLALVTDTYSVPTLHCTCWVVSLTPPPGVGTASGGPPPGRPHKTAYLILFLDAQTGTFVEGIQAGSTG